MATTPTARAEDTKKVPATATATAGAGATAPARAGAADADADAGGETRLAHLARHASPCLLAPQAFFVSWQGVLTLAYSGFPPQLAALKAALADGAHGDALARESPGSRWPKTSLGCVRDGARLTPAQLGHLLRVCREQSAAMAEGEGAQEGEEGAEAGAAAAAASAAPGAAPAAVAVSELSLLTYECRSLERVLARQRLPLAGGPSGGGSSSSKVGGGSHQAAPLPPSVVDPSPPSAAERARVAAVLAEADAPDYWFHASRDGGREGHYRSPAPGVTLVHELFSAGVPAAAPAPAPTEGRAGGPVAAAAPALARLAADMRRFRAAVEAELPGVYAWFDEASLHVTVRAIIA